ncbi:ABC transporter permease, partial [Pantoea agglomerans]
MRQTIIFLTLIPMLTSNVVRTFAWIVILGRQGPVSDALMALGITGMPTSLMFTELGLVLAMCQ